MIASSRRALALAALLIGCKDNATANVDANANANANAITNANAGADAAGASPNAGPTANADAGAGANANANADASAHADGGASLSSFGSAKIKSAKTIGHTSVVFKLTFADDTAAAFKPESKRGKLRYRAEAAAFRLSQALGVTNVPPAYLITYAGRDLRDGMENAGSTTLFADEAILHDGAVRGAVMPWIKGLSFIALEAEPLRSRWRSWMRARSVPSGEYAELAPEISALCVFDALTGNWDRWSGANVGLDADKKHVLFVDNDGAFFDPVPPGPYAAQLAILKANDRFPRTLIESARKLDLDALDHALGVDETHAPLLSPSQRAGILKRRDDVIAIVDGKIKALGEDVVLSF